MVQEEGAGAWRAALLGDASRSCTALGVVGLAPAAHAQQYVAPPPDPGFTYIFDGSATGSPRRSTSGSSPPARSRSRTRPRPSAAPGGQGQATLDTELEGSFLVGASPFGAYWYPEKAFGDAVFRIQFTVAEHADVSTRNGGVMIRSPEIRYSCPDPANPTGPRIGCSTANGNAATLALKPTGFNFDVCPGAIPRRNRSAR